MMATMTPRDALDITFYCDDLDQEMSVREYFKALLSVLWDEEEGFSGKRPFGNSGWQSDVGNALEVAGVEPHNGFIAEMIEAL